MKFVHREIHAFEDSQRNFEQLEPMLPALLPANNLSDLASASTARNNLGFRWGTQSITWAAAAAASATITHGLGQAPVWFSLALVLSGQVAYLQATAVSSTTISVNGQAAAANSLTGTIYWAAF